MLFYSQAFLLVFLPLVLAAYHMAGAAVRKPLLLLASFIFYGYWDVRLLPLLGASILVNWLLARSSEGAAAGRLPWLRAALAVAVNLGLLAFFKYTDFVAEAAAWAGGWPHERWSIVLPLGISFFTFQQIGYLVDRRRGTAPAYSLLDYALFVSFFPQLVAGPIVRHDELIPQFGRDPHRPGAYERFGRGLILLVLGLVKKVFIADQLALTADDLFATGGLGAGFLEGWLAAASFGLQIFFDFSAYSEMAIGLALMFGFYLPRNFDAPYAATSLTDFWRRWHITLSRFLRDYLFIPLGGSRQGWGRTAAALGVTMLLGGLWHGAAWTFVAWGAVHGVGLVIVHAWRRTGLTLHWLPAWALTMAFVFAAWILFRAEDFATATNFLAAMAGASGFSLALPPLSAPLFVIPAGMLAVLAPSAYRLALEAAPPRGWAAIACAVGFVAVVLHVGRGINQEFIYFQF